MSDATPSLEAIAAELDAVGATLYNTQQMAMAVKVFGILTAIRSHAQKQSEARVSLTLTKRSDDFHCCLTGDEKVWDCDDTIAGAIGKWVLTHGRERGVAVDHTKLDAALRSESKGGQG